MSLVLKCPAEVDQVSLALWSTSETPRKEYVATVPLSKPYEYLVSDSCFLIHARPAPERHLVVDLLFKRVTTDPHSCGYSRLHPAIRGELSFLAACDVDHDHNVTIDNVQYTVTLSLPPQVAPASNDAYYGYNHRKPPAHEPIGIEPEPLTPEEFNEALDDVTSGVIYSQRSYIRFFLQSLEEAWRDRAEFAFTREDVNFLANRLLPSLQTICAEAALAVKRAQTDIAEKQEFVDPYAKTLEEKYIQTKVRFEILEESTQPDSDIVDE